MPVWATMAGHRVQTIKAQGCQEVALAKDYDIVIGEGKIRKVLGEIALPHELAAANLKECRSVS